MTADRNELRLRPQRSFGALLAPTTRDELFAGICILACANGLWGRVLMAVREAGWSGAVFNLDISFIVLLASAACVLLLLREKSSPIQGMDLFVTMTCIILIILPIPALGWVAITALSIYILLFATGSRSRKRAAIVMAALTVPMLWIPLLIEFFQRPILELDAMIVSWLIGSQHLGNLVAFKQGHGYVQIAPACSSITNLSLAFLCWVGVTQFENHRWSSVDILWGFLVCASALTINVMRIGLVAQSREYYQVFHNQYWNEISMAVNVLTMIFAILFSVLGVRRELFSRA
jgi:exosortase/archaeosortase family protein